MKSILKSLIFPVLVLIVGSTFSYYFLVNKADIRYTLSENIPITLSGSASTQSIQQIEVKNLGDAKAEKIVINISGNINTYELLKYSQSHRVTEYKTDKSFELIYPELPPEGGFKLILQSQGNGIKNSEVIIKHNNGLASEALSSENANAIGIIYFIYMLTVIASLFSMIYQNLLQHLHFKAEYNKYDEILKKNKPMYINNEKWSELRKEAINTKIKKFDSIYFYNIETSEVYETLNSGKPNYLNDDEWKYLLKSAKESFKGRYSTFIKENFSILDDNIIKLLKIEKPINFPQKDWIDLLSLSNNEYIDIQKRKFHFNEENIVKEIERTKPEEILDIYWEKYIIFLKEKYTETILNRLDYISDINKYMKEQKIQFLDSSQKKTIEEKLSIVVFFKFLESLNFNMENPVVNTEHEIYLSDVDKNRAERIIAKIVNINFNIKKYEILVKYINEILKNIKLDIDKPSEITELEWTELNNLSKSIQQNNEYKNDINQKYEDITTEYAKIDKIKITLRNEEKYVEKIKCKIIKQLDILNEMINGNVNIIERVEDYEDIFSKGNFQNLLKLRLILKKNDIAETE